MNILVGALKAEPSLTTLQLIHDYGVRAIQAQLAEARACGIEIVEEPDGWRMDGPMQRTSNVAQFRYRLAPKEKA